MQEHCSLKLLPLRPAGEGGDAFLHGKDSFVAADSRYGERDYETAYTKLDGANTAGASRSSPVDSSGIIGPPPGPDTSSDSASVDGA